MAVAKKADAPSVTAAARKTRSAIARRRANDVTGISVGELARIAGAEMVDTLSSRLIAARKKMRWTQQELATRSGVSRSLVAAYEGGAVIDANPDKIVRLAKALGITPEYILDGGEAPAEALPARETTPGMPGDDKEMIRRAVKLTRQFLRQLEDLLDS